MVRAHRSHRHSKTEREQQGGRLASRPRRQRAGQRRCAGGVYAAYRHTLDIGKISGKSLSYGYMRGLGLTGGFDGNSKNDGYASKKRMLVIGPTLMLDVPGFLNLSALWLYESNAPNGIPARYLHKNHGALEADFGIGIGSLPLAFKGYALYIGPKGANEFGGRPRPRRTSTWPSSTTSARS